MQLTVPTHLWRAAGFTVLFLAVFAPGSTERAAGEERPASFDCLMQPSAEVELSASAPGVVREVLVDRGDRVVKGQVVARLNDEVEQTNLAIAALRATTNAAQKSREAKLGFEERRLARNANLIADSVVTEKEAEEMRSSREVAYWDAKEADEQLQLARLQLEQAKAELALREVRATIDGVVTERKHQPGETTNGSYIMKLAQLDPLYAETFVPAQFAAKLHIGQGVLISNDTLDKPVRGEISIIDTVADAASGVLKIRVHIGNSNYDKISGLRCTATFEPN